MEKIKYIKYIKRALYINCTLSTKSTTCLSSYKYANSYKCAISYTALLNAAAESILYATHCNARNAHLAQNAAKCCKNAGKFFPDVYIAKMDTTKQYIDTSIYIYSIIIIFNF